MNFVEVKVCTSTQDLAFQTLQAEPHLKTVWVRSDVQSMGRGRQQKTWCSIEGNILLSGAFLLLNSEKNHPWPIASLLVGRAVAQSLKLLKLWHSDMFLKWPNDIFLQSSSGPYFKIGGILCELKSSTLIVGVGINLNSAPRVNTEDTPYQVGALAQYFNEIPTVKNVAKRISQEVTTHLNLFRINPNNFKNRLFEDLNTHWMKKFWDCEGFEAETGRTAKPIRIKEDGSLEVKFYDNASLGSLSSGEFHLKRI